MNPVWFYYPVPLCTRMWAHLDSTPFRPLKLWGRLWLFLPKSVFSRCGCVLCVNVMLEDKGSFYFQLSRDSAAKTEWYLEQLLIPSTFTKASVPARRKATPERMMPLRGYDVLFLMCCFCTKQTTFLFAKPSRLDSSDIFHMVLRDWIGPVFSSWWLAFIMFHIISNILCVCEIRGIDEGLLSVLTAIVW